QGCRSGKRLGWSVFPRHGSTASGYGCLEIVAGRASRSLRKPPRRCRPRDRLRISRQKNAGTAGCVNDKDCLMPRTVVPSAVVALIDNTFTWVTSGENPPQLSGDNAGELTGVVEAIEAIPPELIVLVPPEFAQFIAARGRLRHRIDTWVSRGPGNYNVNGANVRQIRNLLTQCPDAVPIPMTTQLAFVTDVDLRDQLRIDIGWATQAFTNGDWKAATVLSGSIVEALLLWALDHADQQNVVAAVTALENSNVL